MPLAISRYSFGPLNVAAHSPEDKQRDRTTVRVRHKGLTNRPVLTRRRVRAPAASSALTVRARGAYRALPERRHTVQPQDRHIARESLTPREGVERFLYQARTGGATGSGGQLRHRGQANGPARRHSGAQPPRGRPSWACHQRRRGTGTVLRAAAHRLGRRARVRGRDGRVACRRWELPEERTAQAHLPQLGAGPPPTGAHTRQLPPSVTVSGHVSPEVPQAGGSAGQGSASRAPDGSP
jgi:hypothetical protein